MAGAADRCDRDPVGPADQGPTLAVGLFFIPELWEKEQLGAAGRRNREKFFHTKFLKFATLLPSCAGAGSVAGSENFHRMFEPDEPVREKNSAVGSACPM